MSFIFNETINEKQAVRKSIIESYYSLILKQKLLKLQMKII